ncbi:MAG TPA: enoyl-CoA hydratase-related protein [Allosphingosinicella sp.]|nr:enoyl-CoA hydratase-related protein [Allosphingosinicella sp.]
MDDELVLFERRNSAAVITINRPDRRNALNEGVADGIMTGIERAEADPACRSIILTGAGDRAFCAGGDLGKDKSGTPFDIDFANPRSFVIKLLKRMNDCRLPIIARVNGHALAGGFGLLCACDMAVSVDTARFGTPESRIGIFPMMILPHMMRVIPRRHLLEMCITGEQIDAEQARQFGILNHVVAAGELDEKVEWLAARVARSSPTGIRIGKMALSAMQDMTMEQALEYAQATLLVMTSTDDAAEGIRAFQEKRSPAWADAPSA